MYNKEHLVTADKEGNFYCRAVDAVLRRKRLQGRMAVLCVYMRESGLTRGRLFFRLCKDWMNGLQKRIGLRQMHIADRTGRGRKYRILHTLLYAAYG